MSTKEMLSMCDLDEQWDPPWTLKQVFGASEVLDACRLKVELDFRKKGWELDVAQEAFQATVTKFLTRSHFIDATFSSPRRFRRYLVTSATRWVYEQFRKQSRKKTKSNSMIDQATRQEEKQLEIPEHLADQLRELFEDIRHFLSPSQSAALLFKAYSRLGWEHADMTTWQAEMAVKESTRRSHVFRGKQRVKYWLEEGKFPSDLEPILNYLFEGKLK